MKILIIEDDYVSYNIFKTFLQHYGTCDNATTGKDAIDIYNNALFSGNAYDLILIDIILPDMNGQEILKLIRFEEERRSSGGMRRAKIVLTTSLDDEENRKIAATLQGKDETYYAKASGLNGFREKLEEVGFFN
ncbi:MAG: hypothetical protein A2Y25_04730 [Candidatus Melainabacteria bacterium GWF2_37_15]|nr:MAG: hypothetical protein A2Y25_04730 [Candidatus Melainabacteria bacterium GWF2_37_15]